MVSLNPPYKRLIIKGSFTLNYCNCESDIVTVVPVRNEGYVFTGVCLSTGGGVCLSVCWDTTPPGADTPLGADIPLEQTSPWNRHSRAYTPPRSRHPPSRHPPGSRHPQNRHPPGADNPQPLWEQTPPARHPPEQTPHPPPHGEMATAADGTHPTGMHSCSEWGPGTDQIFPVRGGAVPQGRGRGGANIRFCQIFKKKECM